MRIILFFSVFHLIFYTSLTAKVSAFQPEAQAQIAFRQKQHESVGGAENGLDRGEEAWYTTYAAFQHKN